MKVNRGKLHIDLPISLILILLQAVAIREVELKLLNFSKTCFDFFQNLESSIFSSYPHNILITRLL